ncbi:hypothetical protein KO561_14725 [Radiobacillus kanasensis]|uniref:CBO0543 family protein n=1 Tax=Radiobacillus kanasensis TaxID=2844358 RepID=UPI001E284C20|nr:CBO0543 family protein [Radiobacillus kanasensis]UFT98441.1 hypothetical protein KO561_14725 [Radiobacillus kanasensis]
MSELGKKIDTVSTQLTDLRIEIWTKHTVFTWQWWMLVVICLLFITLLFVFIKKQTALTTAAYFGVIYILNKNLDDVATAMDWYDYRMQLEPIIPTMLPANLFIIPIGCSILYQRFEGWRSFLISIGLFAGFVSYIGLPLMKTIDIYVEKNWNPNFSFISLLLISILSKIIIDQLKLSYKST